VIPPLDDEFAKDLGSESLEELREKVRGEIEEEKRLEVEREMNEQILDHLIEKNRFEVPQSMVERQIDALIRELKLGLAYQGVELNSAALDEERLREDYRERAVRLVKSTLLLNRIAEMEGIEVSQGELDREFEGIAGRADRTKSQVEAYYSKENRAEGLRARLLEEKTLRFLREKARVTDLQGKVRGGEQ
ncbi:MAG: trigger factor, partial [Deltaproteobacteria bacterium]|nr:trigger factor [Deltaproteobacteria bacterium]